MANELEEKILGRYLLYPVAYPCRLLGTRNDVHDYLLHWQTNNNRRMKNVWIE